MPDDVQPVETTPETPVVEIPTPVDTPTPIVPVAVSWEEELNKADPKLIRSHPRIAGIIGSELQRAQQSIANQVRAEAEAKAAADAYENLRRLAQEDPVTFAEQWTTEDHQRQLQSQLNNVHGQARHELATAIGRAYADVPEWSELTAEDHQALAMSLQGKSDEEVIPLFTQQALSLVAEHRAQKKLAGWKATELAREREAIRQEEAAKLLNSSTAPDLTPPKRLPAQNNIAGMSDKEFDQYWNEKHR